MKDFWFSVSVHLNTVKGITDANGRVHVLALVTVNYQYFLNILPLVCDLEVTTGTHQDTTSECILSL